MGSCARQRLVAGDGDSPSPAVPKVDYGRAGNLVSHDHWFVLVLILRGGDYRVLFELRKLLFLGVGVHELVTGAEARIEPSEYVLRLHCPSCECDRGIASEVRTLSVYGLDGCV